MTSTAFFRANDSVICLITIAREEPICNWLCEKGSYNFSKFSILMNHISLDF